MGYKRKVIKVNQSEAEKGYYEGQIIEGKLVIVQTDWLKADVMFRVEDTEDYLTFEHVEELEN